MCTWQFVYSTLQLSATLSLSVTCMAHGLCMEYHAAYTVDLNNAVIRVYIRTYVHTLKHA